MSGSKKEFAKKVLKELLPQNPLKWATALFVFYLLCVCAAGVHQLVVTGQEHQAVEARHG